MGTLQALLEASGSTDPSQKQQHLAEAKMCYLRLLDRLQEMYHGLMEEGRALRETLGWEASNWVIGDREAKWVAHRDHTQKFPIGAVGSGRESEYDGCIALLEAQPAAVLPELPDGLVDCDGFSLQSDYCSCV